MCLYTNIPQEEGTNIVCKACKEFHRSLPTFSSRKLKQIKLIQQSDTKPEMWKRYIDDIFSLGDRNKTEVDHFIKQTNKFHPAIKFTATLSGNEIISPTQWCLKGSDLKTNPSWMLKLITCRLKPINIHISSHTSPQA